MGVRSFVFLLVGSLVFTGAALAQTETPSETPSPRPTRLPFPGRATVITLPNADFVYKNAAPLRSGGIGTPLIGYREEPTLIFRKSNGGRLGTTTVYDTKGNRLTSCPKASAEGFAGRYRCTNNTRGMCRQAKAKTRNKSVLFKVDTNKYIKVPNSGICYGSDKGLCNRELC